MSVPITVIVRNADSFLQEFSEDSFIDQMDEGTIIEEPFTSDELAFQMDVLKCYDAFKPQLPEATKDAFESFANRVLWSWRDDAGIQQIDVELDSEGLDSSFNPATSAEILSQLNAIDWECVEKAFTPTQRINTATEFRAYFHQWQSAFEKSNSNGSTVFVFVFP